MRIPDSWDPTIKNPLKSKDKSHSILKLYFHIHPQITTDSIRLFVLSLKHTLEEETLSVKLRRPLDLWGYSI